MNCHYSPLEIRVFDCSSGHLLRLVHSWTPHLGGALITNALAVDMIGAFLTTSDTGEVAIWSHEGQPIAQLGQKEKWPLKDPIMAGHEEAVQQVEEVQVKAKEEEKTAVEEEEELSYRDLHPFYLPKTLTKAGLRTQGFNPFSEAQPDYDDREQRVVSKTPLQHSLAKLEAKLRAQHRKQERQTEAAADSSPQRSSRVNYNANPHHKSSVSAKKGFRPGSNQRPQTEQPRRAGTKR